MTSDRPEGIKIYRVVPDGLRFQSLELAEPIREGEEPLRFDGTFKLETWQPPQVRILDPSLPRGSFLGFVPGSLAVDPSALEEILDLLEISGEVLPLPCGKELLHVLNVTECIDALDPERCDWEVDGRTGRRLRPRRYAFRRHRLNATPLFSVPETCELEILAAKGFDEPADDFMAHVEDEKLTGLRFEEIWSDDELGEGRRDA